MLRLLPSISALLQSPEGLQLSAEFGRSLATRALRQVVAEARVSLRQGAPCPSPSELLSAARRWLSVTLQPSLRPVINATGVIINTNLGRAPLSASSLQALQAVAQGYANLEYDLEAGERGSRSVHAAALLRELTGAEAALVVNNNAAAVLLALSTLAAGREVIISRGQLVEIGGGFRVPDVMRQSGCLLVEVGTTNRTRLGDYAAAISERTALLLAVHPSNFRLTGFVESTPVGELVHLAHDHGLLVMEDLGSGCLIPSERYGLAHEPMPQESLAAGVDLVCFSGDKLLGGPQAGIILGRSALLERIARHPLMRALRVDKLTLAALEATLRHYQRGEAEEAIPVWRMIAFPLARLQERATRWAQTLQGQGVAASVRPGESTIGGGSLPGETLPTALLALEEGQVPCPLEELARRLRSRPVPIVGRILRDALLLDPRTVLEEQDEELLRGLLACLRDG
ncbi:L-seryl-tRNA(Sec) selenium transferase [Thermogemmatispora carboxidivorans]|uniref:L-seryl-tRNA(Sec) selenium transferase n=1 Tax=Thermogemmatispora carboxidivorans TaxID=1382306 RepID=UPI00069B6D64|nr:L-seryl-tRNA(Sec) selenium transferase [Thermogemmatispora carboxidivorans]